MNFKKAFSSFIEYLRPTGVVAAFFIAEYYGETPQEVFSILAPILIAFMAGTIGLEGLFFYKEGSEKLGYKGSRDYQRQNALTQIAIAITAVLIPIFGWGIYGLCSISTLFMLFFLFSGSNHAYSWLVEGNKSITNLMRPIISIVLIVFMLIYMLAALGY